MFKYALSTFKYLQFSTYQLIFLVAETYLWLVKDGSRWAIDEMFFKFYCSAPSSEPLPPQPWLQKIREK